MKHLRASITLVSLGMLLTACGGAAAPAASAPAAAPSTPASSAVTAPATSAPTHIAFQTDFIPTGWDAGYLAAVDQGFFKRQGLDVTVEMGTGSFQTAEEVAKGTEDLGAVDGGTMIQAIDQGLPVLGVASIFKLSPDALIVPAASGITSVAQLKGKSIGVSAGDSTAHMLPGILAYNHLTPADVHLVNMENNAMVPALLQHRVAAISTLAIGLGTAVDLQGMPTRALLDDDNGLELPGYSLTANRPWLQSNGPAVTRFILAVRQGWAWAKANPTAAIAILVKHYPTAKTKILTAQFKASLPFWNDPVGSPYDLQQYTQGQQEMVHYGVVKQAKPVADLVTNRYVPPIGQ